METIDPIIATDIILALVILAFSIISYRKNNSRATMYIGITFALFLVSYGLELFGLREQMLYFIIVLRVIAFLSIASAIYYLKEGSGVFSHLFNKE